MKWCALALLLAATSRITAAENDVQVLPESFVTETFPLRVLVNLAAIDTALNTVVPLRYYGRYSNNGVVCGTAEVEASLEGFSLAGISHWNHENGRTDLHVLSEARARLRVPNCLLNIQLACAALNFPNSDEAISSRTSCYFGSFLFRSTSEIKLTVPTVLRRAGAVSLALPSAKSPDGPHFEFGIIDSGGTFRPLPEPRTRTIKLSSRQVTGPGVTGRTFDSVGVPTSRRERAAEAVFDFAAGAPAITRHTSQVKAETLLYPALAADVLVGVEIADEFFVSGNGGVLKQSLPIRVKGSTRILGMPASYEGVLSAATVEFASGSAPTVVSMRLQSQGFRLSTPIGSFSVSEPLVLTLRAGAPQFEADGAVVLRAKEAELSIPMIGNWCLIVHVDVDEVLPLFSIAELDSVLEIATPECLDFENLEKLKPSTPDYRPKSCASPPLPGFGQVARGVGPARVRLIANKANIRTAMNDGKFKLEIPYEVVKD